MNRIYQLIKHYHLSLLTGLLVGTSFIPFPPWAILFCYAPLWLSLQNETQLSVVFKKAWVSQFTLTLIGFYWIAHVANQFAKFPVPLALFATFLFCCFIHLYIPIAITLAHWLTNKFKINSVGRFLMYSFFLILFERVWPSMFPWHLGYSLYWQNLGTAQLAEIFGFIGLSSFILFSNSLLAVAWISKNKKFKFAVIGIVAAIWFTFEVTGWKIKQNLIPEPKTLTVTLAHANIGNLEEAVMKYGRRFRERIVDDFIKLTESEVLINKSDLVIWPESAMPFVIEEHTLNKPLVQNLVETTKRWQTSLITGAYGEDPTKMSPPGGPMTYNSLVILNENGLQGKYYKTERLVFGEYLPLGDQFPILYRWIQEAGYFGKGFGPTALPLEIQNLNLHIGPQICYESLFSDFSRELNLKKNNLIVNVTNDHWYGPYSERFQHLYMTLARSIETRTPVLRATNTGITAVALANGDILQKSPYGEKWVHTYKVPIHSEIRPTFYARFGHLLIYFFAFLHLATFLIFYLIKSDNLAESKI